MLSNRLVVPVHCARKFTWDLRTGIAEASDFTRLCGRVYNDAADVGFEVLSPRTGQKVLFTLASDVRDNEGEILKTRYTSSSGLTIEIFND